MHLCCSVAQSCQTLCNPMDCSMPGFPLLNHLLELVKLMSTEWVMQHSHLVLGSPFCLLPSIFPSIRVFSNESFLCIRWPKYWSFSFINNPSNEHSGLISFRMDWFSGKESICQCRRPRLIPGSRPPGGGNGNPFQYSCLDNPMDREA